MVKRATICALGSPPHFHGDAYDADPIAHRLYDAAGHAGYGAVLLSGDGVRDLPIRSLVKTQLDGLGPGDEFLFGWVGHGGREDGFDEWPTGYLVTADERERLEDWELQRLLLPAAARGVKVLAILEACSSGGFLVPDRELPAGDVPPVFETVRSRVVCITSSSDVATSTVGLVDELLARRADNPQSYRELHRALDERWSGKPCLSGPRDLLDGPRWF